MPNRHRPRVTKKIEPGYKRTNGFRQATSARVKAWWAKRRASAGADVAQCPQCQQSPVRGRAHVCAQAPARAPTVGSRDDPLRALRAYVRAEKAKKLAEAELLFARLNALDDLEQQAVKVLAEDLNSIH